MSSCSRIIPEEMDFDDPSTENDVNPGLNIKEAFEKLMKTDKELSTKVLTYKPLQLEDVYKTFRKQGVKLKMNDLMDFLDEHVRNLFMFNFCFLK